MKSVEFLLQTLEKNGVEVIFGNPGTTEIPLVRACERQRKIRYVVALSEVAAVPMADGYARARRTLGVVNLHVAPGLGNGMGALYTAGIAGTPLLVLIGGQDRRFLHTHPILWGPLEKMAGSVCKAVFGLNTRHDTAANIRRALRMALTPPFAPVALVCPPDLLEQEIDDEPAAVRAPTLPGLDAETAEEYARFLTWAKRPVIVAAEDVHWSNAAADVEAIAAAFTAPVYAAPYTGVLPISAGSPWYAGYLPPSLKQIAERLERHDAMLFVGGRGLRTTLFSDASLPQRKAWIGHDASVQAVDGEFELACVADIARALRAIGSRVRAKRSRPERRVAAAAPRAAACQGARAAPDTRDRGAARALRRCDLVRRVGALDLRRAPVDGACRGRIHHQRQRRHRLGIGGGGRRRDRQAQPPDRRRDRRRLDALRLRSAVDRGPPRHEDAARRAREPALCDAQRSSRPSRRRRAQEAFTIEPPVLDFSGLAKLYGWKYASAANENELKKFLSAKGLLAANTLLELKLDPALKPVTASRHF